MKLKSIEIFHLGRNTILKDSSRLVTIHFRKFLKGKDRNKIFSKVILEPLHKFNRVCGWARRFSSRLNGPFVFKVRVFSSIAISLTEFLFKDHLPHIGAFASGLNLSRKASKEIVNNSFKETQYLFYDFFPITRFETFSSLPFLHFQIIKSREILLP